MALRGFSIAEQSLTSMEPQEGDHIRCVSLNGHILQKPKKGKSVLKMTLARSDVKAFHFHAICHGRKLF